MTKLAVDFYGFGIKERTLCIKISSPNGLGDLRIFPTFLTKLAVDFYGFGIKERTLCIKISSPNGLDDLRIFFDFHRS